MKKMVFMAAFVAACAAFVACSSDDDLVQQKPGVPEESVEEGIPMTVKVADFTSRGTDYSISGTNPLQEFTLYSTMSGAWETGKLFGKDSGGNWTTNSDLAWPDKETYTFFGISDVDNLADLDEDSHKDVPVVAASTCSFNYAMPISLKPGTDDEYYYNSEDLKDLLVAKTTCSSESGDPKGTLEVEFQHALAQITAIKVYCNADRMASINKMDETEDIPYWRFRIGGESIRIGGLKAKGTYTFDASTPWAVSGDGEEFVIPINIPENVDAAFAMGFAPSLKSEAKTVIPLTDAGFYLIPQAAAGKIVTSGDLYDIDGPYIEFDAQMGHYADPDKYGDPTDNGWVWEYGHDVNPVDWTAADSKSVGFAKIRVPLKFDISTTGAGKGFTLVIDISNALCWEDAGYREQYEPIFGKNVEIQVGG